MATLQETNANDYEFKTNAIASAQEAANAYESKLSGQLQGYLDSSYAAQQEAQEIRRQSALDAITRQVRDTQEQYQTDVQKNYVQKMIAQHTLANELNSQGINNTGLATSQKIGLNNQYAQNYNELTTQKAKDVRSLGEKELDTINEYNAQAKELESEYNKNALSLNQYISEQAENKYNTTYQLEYDAARQAKIDFDNAQQRAYENYWSEVDRENALKQQAWENEFAERQLRQQYTLAQQSYNSSNNSYSGNELSQLGDGSITGFKTNAAAAEYKNANGLSGYTITKNGDGTYSLVPNKATSNKSTSSGGLNWTNVLGAIGNPIGTLTKGITSTLKKIF